MVRSVRRNTGSDGRKHDVLKRVQVVAIVGAKVIQQEGIRFFSIGGYSY
jgi:hypothetical protein